MATPLDDYLNVCLREDSAGKRCRFGRAHIGRCRGSLSDRQRRALKALAERGTAEVFAPGTTLASLVDKGLVARRYIGQRWYLFRITQAGTYLALEIE